MSKIKVIIVFGTRPEAIKLAPVIQSFSENPEKFTTIVCVTAQHRDMLDQVLDIYDIKPHYDLNIMTQNQDLFHVTSRTLDGIKRALEAEKPQIMLVQGDTTTTMTGALAAYYMGIPVGHVEAGLRTHDKHAPFPEEMNRHITSVLADLHFAPTQKAKQNLLKEGVSEDAVLVTGNTSIDAISYIIRKLRTEPAFLDGLRNNDLMSDDSRKHILVTAHRRENFGGPIREICFALKEIAARNEDVSILYPVHKNPNISNPVFDILGDRERITLTDPMDYFSFVRCMERAHIILTDSGGVQEEAPSFGKPVLVLRQKTERVEAVEAGTVMVVGTEKDNIIDQTERLLRDEELYMRFASAVNPYGDGRASARIADAIIKFFG